MKGDGSVEPRLVLPWRKGLIALLSFAIFSYMVVQLATRIDSKLKGAVAAYCRARGIKMSKFIEDALLDRLEELEDETELEALRHEPRRSLQAFIADLKRRGRL
jgi:hypothetical protein